MLDHDTTACTDKDCYHWLDEASFRDRAVSTFTELYAILDKVTAKMQELQHQIDQLIKRVGSK